MRLINNTLLWWLTVLKVQFNSDKPFSIDAVSFMENYIMASLLVL